MTVGCVRTILLLIEAKALRLLGRNENNINMCNSSSLIMKNFRNGTDKSRERACATLSGRSFEFIKMLLAVPLTNARYSF